MMKDKKIYDNKMISKKMQQNAVEIEKESRALYQITNLKYHKDKK